MKQLFFNFNEFNSLKLDSTDIIISDHNHDACYVILNEFVPLVNVPLILLKGSVGTGKTLIGGLFSKKYQGSVCDFSQVLEGSLGNIIKSKYCFVDNVKLYNKAHEDALFELYNFVINNNIKLLMSTNYADLGIQISSRDLLSRFSTIMVLAISKPDNKILRSIIYKMLKRINIYLDEKIIDFLIKQEFINLRMLDILFNKVYISTMQNNRPISLAVIKTFIQNLH